MQLLFYYFLILFEFICTLIFTFNVYFYLTVFYLLPVYDKVLSETHNPLWVSGFIIIIIIAFCMYCAIFS